MAEDNKKGKKGGKVKKAGLAGAAAGAALLGASAYYLFGPDKKAHQKKAKAFYEKMKKEVVREAKRAKAITVPVYHQAVDAVTDAYAKQYKLHEDDIRAIAKKLKGEWKNMKGAAANAGKGRSKSRSKSGGKKSAGQKKNRKS